MSSPTGIWPISPLSRMHACRASKASPAAFQLTPSRELAAELLRERRCCYAGATWPPCGARLPQLHQLIRLRGERRSRFCSGSACPIGPRVLTTEKRNCRVIVDYCACTCEYPRFWSSVSPAGNQELHSLLRSTPAHQPELHARASWSPQSPEKAIGDWCFAQVECRCHRAIDSATLPTGKRFRDQ